MSGRRQLRGERSRAQILSYLRAYYASTGYPPTTYEIAFDLGMSRSNVSQHLDVLEARGEIARRAKADGARRGFRMRAIVPKGVAA